MSQKTDLSLHRGATAKLLHIFRLTVGDGEMTAIMKVCQITTPRLPLPMIAKHVATITRPSAEGLFLMVILGFVLCFLCFLVASSVALVFCVSLESTLNFPNVDYIASWFLGGFCLISKRFLVTC